MSASPLSPFCPRAVVSVADPSTGDEFPSSSLPSPPIVRCPNCRRFSLNGLSSSLPANAKENGESTIDHFLCSSSLCPSGTDHLFAAFTPEQSVGAHSRAESCLELEALAAVHHFAGTVQDIAVSEMLPRTSDLIFVNVTTLEAQPFCLELTAKGWRVTSMRTDCMQGDFTRMELFTNYYQSLHQLMGTISPEYRNRFTKRLE